MVMCMGMMLTACDDRTVYSHYESTPVKGWERNDTLSFDVAPMQQTGQYVAEVGLRIAGSYPFKGVTLVVEQTVMPSNMKQTYTLNCDLIDDLGRIKGKGINHYQYSFPLSTLKLNEGESLHVSIHHDMKREILPGITDVGLKLSRQVATSVQTKENEKQEGETPQR